MAKGKITPGLKETNTAAGAQAAKFLAQTAAGRHTPDIEHSNGSAASLISGSKVAGGAKLKGGNL